MTTQPFPYRATIHISQRPVGEPCGLVAYAWGAKTSDKGDRVAVSHDDLTALMNKGRTLREVLPGVPGSVPIRLLEAGCPGRTDLTVYAHHVIVHRAPPYTSEIVVTSLAPPLLDPPQLVSLSNGTMVAFVECDAAPGWHAHIEIRGLRYNAPDAKWYADPGSQMTVDIFDATGAVRPVRFPLRSGSVYAPYLLPDGAYVGGVRPGQMLDIESTARQECVKVATDLLMELVGLEATLAQDALEVQARTAAYEAEALARKEAAALNALAEQALAVKEKAAALLAEAQAAGENKP